jgi:hypothetical protein
MAKKQKSSGGSIRKRRSSSVPGSYRGFSYQATRFLVHLLKSTRESTVCLEAFEDVGVETPAGSRLAEQTKSYLSRNPLATRAPELWKPLRNWVDAVIAKDIDASATSFVLCAPGASPCEIATRFHEAKTLQAAAAAIDFAKATLNGSGKLTDSENLRAHLEFLFAHRDQFGKVIIRFSIDTPPVSADEELKPLVLAMLVSDDAYDDVVRWAHGWVKQRIDEQVATSKPARVKTEDFHNALLNYVRTHDRLDILRSYAGIPSSTDVANELSFREYVRQLRLIDLEDVGILEAVNDYLRAVIDRTLWSEKGFVDETALDDFAQSLTSTWRNIRRRTFLMASDKSSEVQGQLLYSECVEHRALLDGYDPPSHFVKGSLHALSDDHKIGWHPSYENLLKISPPQTADSH